MPITLERETFAHHVHLSTVFSGKNTNPILSRVLLERGPDCLWLRAHSSSGYIRSMIPAEVNGTFETHLVDSMNLRRILSLAKTEKTVAIGRRKDNGLGFEETDDPDVHIHIGNASYRLPSENVGDFPEIWNSGETMAIADIQLDVFQTMLLRVRPCLGHEAMRFLTNCVSLERSEGRWLAIATDGKRLGISEAPAATSEPFSVLLPDRLVETILKLPKGTELLMIHKERDAYSSGVSVQIRIGNVTIAERLAEGEFPPWKTIIPDTFAQTVSIPGDVFRRAVDRAAIFASSVDDGLVLDIRNHELEIRHKSVFLASECRSRVPIESEARPIMITMGAKYVSDAVNQIEGDTIRISENGPRSVVLLEGDGLRHYIMPREG